MYVIVPERCKSKKLFKGPMIAGMVLLLCLFAGFERQCYASAVENDDLTRLSLQGLEGVYVAVRTQGPKFENHGLTELGIKGNTELQLKTAGIPVLTHSQWTATKGGPVFYVEVDIVHDSVMTDVFKSDLYAYVVTVEFNQDVSLVRDPTIKALSPTWSSSYLGLTNSVSRVGEKVKEMVGGFVQVYLAVNPGQPVGEKSGQSQVDVPSAAESEETVASEQEGQPDAVTGYEVTRPATP